MTRYELKIQLSTDADIQRVKDVIQGLSKSGKVDVHWIRSQEIGPVGRPDVMKERILSEMEQHDYPRSAKQLAAALEVAQTSLYRVLYNLVAENKLTVVVDSRWRTKRFGDEAQVLKFEARETARLEKARRAVEQADLDIES